MASSANQNYFSAGALNATGTSLLGVTTATVITRFIVRYLNNKAYQIEDVLLFCAWLAFMALTVCYMVVTPRLYHVSDVVDGQAEPYPEIIDDSLFIIKIFFSNTILLWVALWLAKFSLLFFYRRLMDGLRTYMILWRILVAFCVLAFCGAVATSFTSCSSMHAWFTPGQCGTPRDVKAQIISLYFSYAVDALTNILIMALPIQLIWKLQMPRTKKVGVGAIFGCGLICIAASTIRVIQIGVKAGNSSTPSSSWLALWAEVEASIAVMIGCAPAFAVFWRSTRVKAVRSGGSGESGSSGLPVAQNAVDIELQSAGATTSAASRRGRGRDSAIYWYVHERGDVNSSQEELASADASRIYVTRSVRQDSEDSGVMV